MSPGRTANPRRGGGWMAHVVGALAAALALASTPGASADLPTLWTQRTFLIGGWCIGREGVPASDLIQLDAAGLDYLTDMEYGVDRGVGIRFAARMDSLRRSEEHTSELQSHSDL